MKARRKRYRIDIPCKVSCRGESTAEAELSVEVTAYDRRSAIHAVERALEEAAQKGLSPPDPEQGLHGGGDSG
jgi:hypothetical protein